MHNHNFLYSTVFVHLNVTPEVSSIRAEVVEYSNDYISDVQYIIRLSGYCQNETNFTACYNESKRLDKQCSVSFEHLVCQQSYGVQLWWISSDNFTECYLNETIISPYCPGTTLF